MPIRLKYDVVGVPLSEAGVSPAKRKFGQELIGQQRKYDFDTKQLQQKQYNDNLNANRDFARDLQMDQNKRQFEGDAEKARRATALADRDEQRGYNKSEKLEDRDWRAAEQEKIAQRQAEKEAKMAERADIRDGIENGEFGDANSPTVRRLKELELAEMNARAGKTKDGRIDPAQQAEALQKIEAERAGLVQNRLPRKAPPSADAQIKSRTSSDGRQRVQPGGKIEDVPPPPQQGPIPSWEGFRKDPKEQARYQEQARNELTEGGKNPAGASDPRAVNRRAAELWDIDEEARQAPPQAVTPEPSPPGPRGYFNPATVEKPPVTDAPSRASLLAVQSDASANADAAGMYGNNPAPAPSASEANAAAAAMYGAPPVATPPAASAQSAPAQEELMDADSVKWSQQPIGTRLRRKDGTIVVKNRRNGWNIEQPVAAGQAASPVSSQPEDPAAANAAAASMYGSAPAAAATGQPATAQPAAPQTPVTSTNSYYQNQPAPQVQEKPQVPVTATNSYYQNQPAATPSPPVASANSNYQNQLAAAAAAASWQGAKNQPAVNTKNAAALAPGHPDYKPMPTPTGQIDANGFAIMSDGSRVDPRDSDAMKSGGRRKQAVMRLTNPDGSPIKRTDNYVQLEASDAKQQADSFLNRPPVTSRNDPKQVAATQQARLFLANQSKQSKAAALETKNFWDAKVAGAGNKVEKNEYTAIKNFVTKNQSPAVQNAIMKGYDPAASLEEKQEAMRFLLDNGIDLEEITKKQRVASSARGSARSAFDRDFPRGPKY